MLDRVNSFGNPMATNHGYPVYRAWENSGSERGNALLRTRAPRVHNQIIIDPTNQYALAVILGDDTANNSTSSFQDVDPSRVAQILDDTSGIQFDPKTIELGDDNSAYKYEIKVVNYDLLMKSGSDSDYIGTAYELGSIEIPQGKRAKLIISNAIEINNTTSERDGENIFRYELAATSDKAPFEFKTERDFGGGSIDTRYFSSIRQSDSGTTEVIITRTRIEPSVEIKHKEFSWRDLLYRLFRI